MRGWFQFLGFRRSDLVSEVEVKVCKSSHYITPLECPGWLGFLKDLLQFWVLGSWQSLEMLPNTNIKDTVWWKRTNSGDMHLTMIPVTRTTQYAMLLSQSKLEGYQASLTEGSDIIFTPLSFLNWYWRSKIQSKLCTCSLQTAWLKGHVLCKVENYYSWLWGFSKVWLERPAMWTFPSTCIFQP